MINQKMLAVPFRALQLCAASAHAITTGTQKFDPLSECLLLSCLCWNSRFNYFMTRREMQFWYTVFQFRKLDYSLKAVQLLMKKVVRSLP